MTEKSVLDEAAVAEVLRSLIGAFAVLIPAELVRKSLRELVDADDLWYFLTYQRDAFETAADEIASRHKKATRLDPRHLSSVLIDILSRKTVDEKDD